ncbi:MAG TPA: hypothetical protein VK530_03040 [Candidatus Acidoferrum sp.]|nr:hypothetical protein [Candidatus Acidoferrum sp.]
MKREPQLDLFAAPKAVALAIPKIDPKDANVVYLVKLLDGRDWILAADILTEMQKPVNEGNKRWLRALADASCGRIAGGQRGYRLVTAMTQQEYNTWRNGMNHQADEMKRRVIEADRVFYARTPVEVGV